MKKFLCLTLSAIAIMSTATANARLKSIASTATRSEISNSGMSTTQDNLITAEEYCPTACPGFTTETLDCGQDMEPKACVDSDCGNYYKCMPVVCEEGFDTKLKKCALEIQPDNYRCSKCAQ